MSKVVTVLVMLVFTGAAAQAATTVKARPEVRAKQAAQAEKVIRSKITGEAQVAVKTKNPKAVNQVVNDMKGEVGKPCTLADARAVTNQLGGRLNERRVETVINTFAISDGQCAASGETMTVAEIAELVLIGDQALTLKEQNGAEAKTLREYFIMAYSQVQGSDKATAEAAYKAFTEHCGLMKKL